MKKNVLLLIITAILFTSCSLQLNFSSRLWKKIPATRQFMTDSLIEKLTSEDLSEFEVMDLLGNKSEEKMNIKQGQTLVYFIRPKTTVGLRSEWLFIEFKNNRIVKAYLAEID